MPVSQIQGRIAAGGSSGAVLGVRRGTDCGRSEAHPTGPDAGSHVGRARATDSGGRRYGESACSTRVYF